MRKVWHVAHMEKGKGVYRVLVGKTEGKRPLATHRNRWEDNINMVLREVERYMDSIHVAQKRDRWRDLVNAAMKLQVP